VDVALDENFQRSARNISGVRVVASGKLTARDVMDAGRVVLTQAAAARLQEVLA
jgi:ribosomal protein L4